MFIPTVQHSHPPTGMPGRATSPSAGLPILYTSIRGVAKAALYCAHRTSSIHLIDPSKLACFSFLGRAPMLVYVRPSNEALLRARVPGAQRPHKLHRHLLRKPRVARAQEIIRLHPPLFRASSLFPFKGGLVDPQLCASNDINVPSKLARYLSAMEAD